MEQKRRILIADDEADILEILEFNLVKAGYEVVAVPDGRQALEKVKAAIPDLILLDIMMPQKTGLEVLQILRADEQTRQIPVILLTALNDDTTQINALDGGADDYISKPISPKVLVSRVHAFFRRNVKPEDTSNQLLEFDGLTIDPVRYVVIHNGEEIVFAKKEFELLQLLASRPGKVFLRNEILASVWGNEVIVGDRTIDVHIRKIRQKMNAECITTVKGVGYKFEW